MSKSKKKLSNKTNEKQDLAIKDKISDQQYPSE
jgi:hypothetical protein